MSFSKENEQKMANLLSEFKHLTEKECYEFKIINEFPHILDDKLGGIPYLPIGELHPKDSKGDLMPLLIQINLKNIILENFPKKGILEIFCGQPLDYPAEYEVRYYEENLEYQKDLPLIKYHGHLAEKPYKLELKKIKEYLPTSNFNFNKLFCSLYKKYFNKDLKCYYDFDNIDSKLNNILNQPAGSIGGYPDFTQDDPRYDGEMKECLFKIDSGLGDLCIGDAGILNVFIRLDDLKNAKFEKAEVYWDCC